MLFENRHNLQVKKVVLSGCLAWQKLMAPKCFDATEDQVWTIHFEIGHARIFKITTLYDSTSKLTY